MNDSIRNGKPAKIGLYGCHNRKPYKKTIIVQDGWTEDGRRKMIEKPFANSMDCRYAAHGYANDDFRCNGCRWMGDLP